MTDLTLADLAEQVLLANYTGTKDQWGEELLQLVDAHDARCLAEEVRRKTVAALGNQVSQVKSRRERTAQNERLMARAVSADGRPMGKPLSPTLSVRTESGARQSTLWIFATPRQYIDAVLREQKVIDGRNDSNAIRLHLVDLIQEDEHLQDLPTLKDVCDELGINPDTLGLEDLEADAS